MEGERGITVAEEEIMTDQDRFDFDLSATHGAYSARKRRSGVARRVNEPRTHKFILERECDEGRDGEGGRARETPADRGR